MDDIRLEETFIKTNGIQLHTVMAGPQSGPPVVLLHGFPETWHGWSRQLPALVRAGCRVIIPDQRGYNLSDKPRDIKSYRMEELTRDILGLIDALDYEKINLIGHDWGAQVAWWMGISHPERLHRLGIINASHPAVMRQFLTRDFEQMRRSLYAAFFQLPWLPEMTLRLGNWSVMANGLRRGARPGAFTEEDIQKYKEAWSQAGAMTSMLNWYRAAIWQPPQITNDMRVRVRTLMLWGVKDVALTYRMARPSIDYCEDGSLIFFPDATHWVQHEEPDEVSTQLLSFILT